VNIVVLDFYGYPYPLALARHLARRGHDVRYMAFAGVTPRTSLRRRAGDPDRFRIELIGSSSPYERYRFVDRWRFERAIGASIGDRISSLAPDVVLSSNTPLDIQAVVQRRCETSGIAFVFWLQDVISTAMRGYLAKRLPIAGRLVAAWYARAERRMLRRSQRVIAITPDFVPLLVRWGVESRCIEVIENWAPIEELPQAAKANGWSRDHGLDASPSFVYAGTLGLKHRPELLLELADAVQGRAKVVVCSEGPGMSWLREQNGDRDRPGLVLLDLQAYERMPEVMGTADVLVGVLETDAAEFSVPSKVLTYLCAGRPVLLSIAPHNLVARMVAEGGCGLVVEPGDVHGFVAAARALLDDAERASDMGRNARLLAESRFDADTITDRFERTLAAALRAPGAP
jgi:glycosyltransferase involved in cell wall biosynthesis